jgi:drug/metabolite transporter (DMT)-like permease
MQAAARMGGITFMLLALMCFGALDTTSKVMTATVPVGLALLVRFAVQTGLTMAALVPRQGLALFHTERPGLQVLRGLSLVVCNGLAYLSLGHLQVGEFTAVVMLTPLVLTVFAARLLREHVSLSRWVFLAGGFVGVMVVLRPGADLLQPATLLPLTLVGFNTAFQLATSTLAKSDKPATTQVYSGLVGLGVGLLMLPISWVSLPWTTWGLLLLMSLFGAVGHFMLIMSHTRAPVATLTPFIYLQIVFGAIGGWLVFRHVPDGWALVGIGIIVVCGLLGTGLLQRAWRAR